MEHYTHPNYVEANVTPCSNVGNPSTGASGSIDSLPLAMAYVPWQKMQSTYDADVALQRGTIFPELDLPFTAKGGK